MTTLFPSEEVPTTEIDMAKAARADPALVVRHADALAAAGEDRVAFETALAELRADEELRVNDVIAIAVGYRRGGVRPRSKTQALQMIEKRFVEIVRDAKRNAVASRVRPW